MHSADLGPCTSVYTMVAMPHAAPSLPDAAVTLWCPGTEQPWQQHLGVVPLLPSNLSPSLSLPGPSSWPAMISTPASFEVWLLSWFRSSQKQGQGQVARQTVVTNMADWLNQTLPADVWQPSTISTNATSPEWAAMSWLIPSSKMHVYGYTQSFNYCSIRPLQSHLLFSGLSYCNMTAAPYSLALGCLFPPWHA